MDLPSNIPPIPVLTGQQKTALERSGLERVRKRDVAGDVLLILVFQIAAPVCGVILLAITPVTQNYIGLWQTYVLGALYFAATIIVYFAVGQLRPDSRKVRIRRIGYDAIVVELLAFVILGLFAKIGVARPPLVIANSIALSIIATLIAYALCIRLYAQD